MAHSLLFIRRFLWLVLLLAASTGTARASSRIAEVDRDMCNVMRATDVLQQNAPVDCTQLRIVHFSYLDFDGKLHDDGAVMVMAAVAEQVQAIFATLLQRKFAIAGARLMDRYRGDDQASMRDNNTSAFNDRPITNGTALSLHAYGLAIDINPVQNPYLQFEAEGKAVYSPAAGSHYANRLPLRPGKPVRKGMAEQVVDVFAEHGFLVWGGNWDTPIDYQHFQVERHLAERMAGLPVAQAHAVFSSYVERYRRCVQSRGDPNRAAAKAACAGAAEAAHP